MRSGRRGVVTIDETCFLSEKWLFVGAHELGHHKLHEVFGVSLPVAALRVLDFTDAPCAVAYPEAGTVRWCTATRAFGVKVRDRRVVPSHSGAAVAHAAREPSGKERGIGASAWGVAGGVRELREHAMAIPGFDAVVTMLWHDEELTAGVGSRSADV